MNNLLSIVLVACLSAGLTACKQEQQASVPDAAKAVTQAPAAPAAPVVAPAAPVVAPAAPAAPAAAEPSKPESKKVCVVINGKEKCKTAKVHKKFEGTQVPPKK